MTALPSKLLHSAMDDVTEEGSIYACMREIWRRRYGQTCSRTQVDGWRKMEAVNMHETLSLELRLAGHIMSVAARRRCLADQHCVRPCIPLYEIAGSAAANSAAHSRFVHYYYYYYYYHCYESTDLNDTLQNTCCLGTLQNYKSTMCLSILFS